MRKLILTLLLTLVVAQPTHALQSYLQIPGVQYGALRALDVFTSPFIKLYGPIAVTIALLEYRKDPPPLPPIITIRNYDPAKFEIYRWMSKRTVFAYTFETNGDVQSGFKSYDYYNKFLGWRSQVWVWIPSNPDFQTWTELITPQWNNWSFESQMWDPSTDGRSYSGRFDWDPNGEHHTRSERIESTHIIKPLKPITWPTEVLVTLDGGSYPLGEFVTEFNIRYWTESFAHLYFPEYPYMIVNPINKTPNYDIYGESLTPPLLLGL